MFRLATTATAAALALGALAGCSTTPSAEPAPAYTGVPVWHEWEPTTDSAGFALESTDFENEGEFPETIRLTTKCGGPNVRPELHWSGAPAGTQSYVITFSYEKNPQQRWLAYDIPADVSALPASPDAPTVGKEGLTSRNSVGFFGPCSLTGEKFRLWFTIYALDTTLDLDSGLMSGDVREAGVGHILAAAELAGYLTGPEK
jgi:Raf kinase inhibitor-like YbhB/YbcL family protein